MKNAYSFFELIIVLFISSLLIVFTLKFSNELNLAQEENYKLEIYKLELNSTKIFLQKNVNELKTKLKYTNKTLFFKEQILLKEVSNFSLQNNVNYININIEIANKIDQNWILKK